MVPWGDLTYIGTTDTDYDGPIDDPQCTPEDIDYLLDAINGSTSAITGATTSSGTWAGLRPLVKSASQRAAPPTCPARHKVQRSDSGVVTITGGKLTTYREMAADTVDEVVADVLGPAASSGSQRHSRTTTPPRCGAPRATTRLMAAADTVSPSAATSCATSPTATAARPAPWWPWPSATPTWREPLVAGLPYLRGRGGLRRPLRDGAHRRRRPVPAHPGPPAGPRRLGGGGRRRSPTLIAAELGWDAEERRRQVAAYRRRSTRSATGPPTCPRSTLEPPLGA